MAIINEDTGDITALYQGDNFRYIISGLLTDQEDYTINWQAYDENRNPIGAEIIMPQTEETITLEFSPEYSDQFNVPKEESNATYYFGIKQCSEIGRIERTLILGNKDYGSLNTITVYPKQVEGN